MSRRKRPEEHVNHERWLVSYADFITLLFAFFVVLFSASQVDEQKVSKLAVAMQVAFQELGVFGASGTTVPVDSNSPVPFGTVQMIEKGDRGSTMGRIVPPVKAKLGSNLDMGSLSELKRELERVLAPEIADQSVEITQQRDGLVISLREIGFFDSGSAALRPEAGDAIANIARVLFDRAERLRIEGHTDNVPIHNTRFASNWELSTSRATELVKRFITRLGYAPERLSAAGFAEYHPVAANDTVEGRALNRRVDIVILTPRRAPPEAASNDENNETSAEPAGAASGEAETEAPAETQKKTKEG